MIKEANNQKVFERKKNREDEAAQVAKLNEQITNEKESI